ncbi:MAG TPA: hypothetical protein VGG77_16085 [Roseiarcus sp.]
MTTTLRADHLAAADALDDLAARCAFDDRLAGKLKKLAARSRLQGDGALHPEIKAWALMKAGEHKAPGQLYGSPPPRPSSASTVLANLVEETLKKRGVAADDPFRGELAERLAEEARRSASAPRLTDLTWAAPATPTTSPDDVELDLLEGLKRLGQFRLARAARRAGEGFVDLVVATLGDGHGIRVANSRAIEVSRRARSKPHNSGSYFELFNGFGGSSFAH